MNLALSNLVLLDWRKSQKEIIDYLLTELGKDKENCELTYIDLFAYFVHASGKDEFWKLMRILPEMVSHRAHELMAKIHTRATNCFQVEW